MIRLPKMSLSILIFLLFGLNFSTIHAQSCDTILYGQTGIYTLIDGNNLPGIGPGSTICLKGGRYYQISIVNLSGSAGSPIVIKPIDSVVFINNNTAYGLKTSGSRYIHLDGLLESYDYGFVINTTIGNGISLDDLSSDIEINHFEIANTNLTGIMAKTDPDCSFTATRDSFTMYNIHIHHNYIHNVRTEGMYIGHSFFNGKTIHCNGKDTLIYPHIIKGVRIYNNRVEHTGYDGIQVSSTTESCSIHDNKISYDSQNEQYGQMSGIIIGNGSACDCYNNDIRFGKGIGIEVHGVGGNRIFNNLIVEAGRTYRPLTQGPYSKPGMYFSYNLYNPGNLPYQVFNNTIYKPKSEGIRFSNINSADNLFYNNIIIDPGIWHYFDSSNIPTIRSYININVNTSTIEKTNYFSRNSKVFGFVDTLGYDLRLQKWSLGVDFGTSVAAWSILFDLNNEPRPQGKGFDIGAYEYQTGQSSELNQNSDKLIEKAYYRSESNELFIHYSSSVNGKYSISLSDIQGKILFKKENLIVPPTRNENIKFKIKSPGLLLINLKNGIRNETKKLIIK